MRASRARLMMVAALLLTARGAGAAEPGSEKGKRTARTPAEIRAAGNHLEGAGSLYLREHAHNPVEWYPWGPEALGRAEREDKPIFLSVGYASCHWCHVMEHEVFEDDAVAALLNADFVCIKVDREERPDLDQTYMDALQAMTGGGGWPMSLFLTPSLKPFYGGTYLPKDRFLALARKVLGEFRHARNEVETRGDAIYADINSGVDFGRSGAVGAAAVRGAVGRGVSLHDPVWGGFGGKMRFPTPIRWRLMLHAFRKWGDTDVGAAVRKTLDGMASGGIHDHLGGGFHRYTTDATWLIPHFEKMLYDNAQLAALYTEAAVVFGSARYREVAEATLDFLLEEMRDPHGTGGFFASFDADSGGAEGSYYTWTPAELEAVAGEQDGAALALLLGVSAAGNFEGGRSVLSRRVSAAHVAMETGRPESEIAGLFGRWRGRLKAARAARPAPTLDRKVITSWNGLAISALAGAYAAFGAPRFREAAERAASFLWWKHRRPNGGLFRASNDGKAVGPGILDDYALLALGLLDLFEATGELEQLRRALVLIDEAERGFREEDGAWYLVDAEAEAPLGRRVEYFDAVRPSGCSAMLEATWRAAALTGRSDLYERVDQVLSLHANLLERARLDLAGWLDVVLMRAGPFYELVIAGDPSAPATRALAAVWRDLSPSWAVRAQVPAGGPDGATEALIPTTKAKGGRGGGPLAYVCVRGSCKRPTADAAVLRGQLTEGWHR